MSETGVTFDALREANTTRVVRWHPPDTAPWNIADWVLAMCGEAGEAANIAKKLRRHETGAVNTGDPLPGDLSFALLDELADVVIYADLVAHYLGFDLGEGVADKFNRTSERHGFPERLAIPTVRL